MPFDFPVSEHADGDRRAIENVGDKDGHRQRIPSPSAAARLVARGLGMPPEMPVDQK